MTLCPSPSALGLGVQLTFRKGPRTQIIGFRAQIPLILYYLGPKNFYLGPWTLRVSFQDPGSLGLGFGVFFSFSAGIRVEDPGTLRYPCNRNMAPRCPEHVLYGVKILGFTV